MNERDIFEAVSDFDESKLVKKPSGKGLGGVFHGRKWLAAIAVCLVSLLICGTAFGAAVALGWIGVVGTEEVTYSDGTQSERYIYAYDLTARVDPADFSDEIVACVDDPEANIPKERLAGGYEAGEFFDGIFFNSPEEAVEFVGIDGVKTFDDLGLKLIPDTCVRVNAGKNNGEMSYAMIDADYVDINSCIDGAIISAQIYSSAYDDDELLGSIDKDRFDAYEAITASGGRGVKFVSKEPSGGHVAYIVLVPDGAIVYHLFFTADENAGEAAENFINSWLALM
ncbi:MAG: hypothetical protein IKQ36_01950 [Clostridia bacterium]|nr:hypothetical protein [Clostridia bacterium]